MNTIVRGMTLQEILKRHGILAASELRRRIVDKAGQPKLSRAQTYNLWRGKAGVGKETMRLLHDQLGISYEELMEVDPVPGRQSKANAQKPKGSSGTRARGRRPQ